MSRATHRHSFVRADGSRFFLDLEIDLTKLARHMAGRPSLHGTRSVAKKCGGAVVAKITEFPS